MPILEDLNVHYHSRIHDVFDIARGKGRIILPAGSGHQRVLADGDFFVVGAYPPAGTFDECTTVEDRPRALKTIPKVPQPRKDLLCGTGGPLSKLWKNAK